MVHLIYGANSKVLRRIILDLPAGVDPAVVGGEALLIMPRQSYDAMDHIQLRDFMKQQVGAPLHDGRIVELSPAGQVVAVFSGDPDIDKPFDNKNTLEVGTAGVGDVKLNGVFVSTRPVLIPLKADVITNLRRFGVLALLSDAELGVLADKIIADAQKLSDDRDLALAQVAAVP